MEDSMSLEEEDATSRNTDKTIFSAEESSELQQGSVSAVKSSS